MGRKTSAVCVYVLGLHTLSRETDNVGLLGVPFYAGSGNFLFSLLHVIREIVCKWKKYTSVCVFVQPFQAQSLLFFSSGGKSFVVSRTHKDFKNSA